MPCIMPFRPLANVAACSGVSIPLPAASTPIRAHTLIFYKRIKHTCGIASSAHARDKRIRQPSLFLHERFFYLIAYYPLKITHHHGITDAGPPRSLSHKKVSSAVRTHSRIASFVASFSVCVPLFRRYDFSSQHLHAENV